MNSSMYGATGITELKKADAWEVAKKRCPKFWSKIEKRAKPETLEWYSTNTRHHVMVFETVGLPKDIDCVWSIFSGNSPEFLALEQYLNRKFNYTAIDCDFQKQCGAQDAFHGNSQFCNTNFINDELENWLKRNVKIDQTKKHLLYFGHPYFEDDTKKLIAEVLRKFQGCQFYIYGAFYIESELTSFLEVMDAMEFLPKERRQQCIEDPNVKKVPAKYGDLPTIFVQPNRFTLLGASPELQDKLFPRNKFQHSANEPLLMQEQRGCCVIL